MRAATPVFFQKAEELRDCWDALFSKEIQKVISSSSASGASLLMQQVASDTPTETVLDVAHWASRATFDVIGLAGFDYHFHSLQDESEEVYLAYRRMFNVADKGPGLKGLLRIYVPFIEKILVSLR